MGQREERGESQMIPRYVSVGPARCQGVRLCRTNHSQHEILFPAGLAPPHSDGRALDILHLQSHICVEFLCGGESRS